MFLRIVSYNIHSGKNLFWQEKLTEMAETLKNLQADIISLQEVHQNSKYGFQVDLFGKKLSFNTIFAPALPVADGAYGNALLTRFPILQSETMLLPGKKEPRSLLKATLAWNETNINVWNTHCSLNKKNRDHQLDIISQMIEKKISPLLLTGDFNTISPFLPEQLKDCAKEKKQEHLSTLLPFTRRIDFVYASSHWKVADYQVIKVKWSDHYPILVTLETSEPQFLA